MYADLNRFITEDLGLKLETQVPLGQYSSIKVGGLAEYFVAVDNYSDLRRLIGWANSSRNPFFVLGGGTNTLFADEGMAGLTIFNRCRSIQTKVEGRTGYLDADSGLPLAQCARYSMRQQLTGLEWAVSVPGTLGGAVVGNAGAHGSDMAACLTEVELCQISGTCSWVSVTRMEMTYRNSCLKPRSPVKAGLGPAVVKVRLRLAREEPAIIKAKANQFLRQRRKTQPTEPSVGSVFRNPPGNYAGVLIEEAGCKGLTCGAMTVSEKHANFIVKLPGAETGLAGDVFSLILAIRQKVQDHAGILLQPEIGLAGEWPDHVAMI